MKWIPLEEIEQLEEILNRSETLPVLIFKHSTRCYISKMALRNFEAECTFDESIPCYFLDLIAHRSLSQAIATEVKVQHESPQLLLIQNRTEIYHASHGAIDAAKVAMLLKSR